jgi:hypothetical protein
MQQANSGRTYPRKGNDNRNASTTKAGPGRFHVSGHQRTDARKLASPHTGLIGASSFVLHTASPAKKERRALVKAHGRRQALKFIKHARAVQALVS